MRASAGSRSPSAGILPFPSDEELPHARIVAGIDEAGLGPLLGPLTIGFSAFHVPAADLDLWREFDGAIASAPSNGDARLLVADSKVVFSRTPRGEARLESVALSFLALRAPSHRPPESSAEFFARIPVDLRSAVALDGESWTSCLADRLPLRADPATIDRHVANLTAAMNAKGIRLCGAGVRVLPVAELNASFSRTENKSRTHWDLSAAILRHLWTEHARDGLDLLVDRHGGRMRYRNLLRETFPEARIVVRSEERARSEYFVAACAADAAPLRMRVAFAERAEQASLPVALASCLAKYARELCMNAFNAYFGGLQPGLRPTAGYVTDGRRWLAEARTALERAGVEARNLVRDR